MKRFLALSGREKSLFCEAILLQFGVGLLLKVIPFRKIPGLFGDHRSKYEVSGLGSDVSGLTLEQIKQATQRAGRISPWKNKCLISSLAARRMLARRKIQSQLSLGVAKDGNGMLMAHAWIGVGDFEVVEKGGKYQELYLF